MTKTTLQLVLLQLYVVSVGPQNEQRVIVVEGSDAVLPCSVRDTPLTYQLFDWKKDGQKEVFMYDAGKHYNNGRGGQDQQFKGRVSHFEEELKNGNASIKISDTKLEDSGVYSCVFPRLQSQRFHIKLLVAAPEPHITILSVKEEGVQLQCHVPSASPKPTVEWQDGAEEVLKNHTEEAQVSEAAGQFNVTLLLNVTKTGHYRCVVTQEEIQHQVYAEISIYIREESKLALCVTGITFMLGGSALIILLLQVRGVEKIKRYLPNREKRSSNGNLESSHSISKEEMERIVNC